MRADEGPGLLRLSVLEIVEVDALDLDRPGDAYADAEAHHQLRQLVAAEVEAILQNSGIPVRAANRAAYAWKDDVLWMPHANAFIGPAEYAATALHELGHATGHESRLNRQFGRQGTPTYAKEELCAELCSAVTGRRLGIPTDIPTTRPISPDTSRCWKMTRGRS